MADFPFGDPPFDSSAARELSRPCYGTPAADVAKLQEFMIRQRRTAWWARKRFAIGRGCGGAPFYSTYRDQADGPVWCFTRFGRTVTQLPFGALLYVGGEHEDFYDPDFCIYNDVVHEDANGNIEIHGYAKDVFPPTDFHTATLVGEQLWLIGSLGYRDLRREGETQVMRLDSNSLAIEPIETGGDGPGWISSHAARFVRGRNEIAVTGGRVWETRGGKLDLHDSDGAFALSLASLEWRRLDGDEARNA